MTEPNPETPPFREGKASEFPEQTPERAAWWKSYQDNLWTAGDRTGPRCNTRRMP